MLEESVVARLERLNTAENQVVDVERFRDTLSMVCDESDPCGYCFLALFMRECDHDLRELEGHLGDQTALSKICHKWIGRCAQLGMAGLERRGRQLQAMAKGDAGVEVEREWILAMVGELERVRSALQYMSDY